MIRLGNRFCLRYTALRTLPLLDAGLHAGRLRRGEPRAEFMSRLGDPAALRRTAGCALPLLHAFLRAGGLRRGKPRAEAVPLGGRRGGPPIRAAVVADKFGISRRGACSKYSLPDDPEVTRGRFCGAPLARRAIPAVGVVFSCRGAGGLFNDLPRPEFVGHDVADGKDAAPPADGTFQFVVSSLQAGWLFLIGLYNVFMMIRITVFRRARKRGNRGQRRHERKYQKY